MLNLDQPMTNEILSSRMSNSAQFADLSLTRKIFHLYASWSDSSQS